MDSTSEPLDARFEKLDADQDCYGDDRQCNRTDKVSETDGSANRCEYPNYRRSGHPGNNTLAGEHDACAEKSDTGDQLTKYAGGVRTYSRDRRAEVYEY